MQCYINYDQTRKQLLNEAFTKHLSNRKYTASDIENFSLNLFSKYDGDEFNNFINSPEELEKAMRQCYMNAKYAWYIRMSVRMTEELENEFAE